VADFYAATVAEFCTAVSTLERLVSAILVEIDEKWASDGKAYIKWECQDA
jgi:hypothetical protein